MCIDLHLHSSYSDGTLSPAALVEEARVLKLRGIALTDHDTVEGVDEFLRAARLAGIPALSGLEISSSFRGYSLHILAYGIDCGHRELAAGLARLQAGREERNEKIIARLQELGLEIRLDELASLSGCGQTGRPHIARLLVRKGVVSTPDDAFRLYLRKGAPAWAGRYVFPAEECIALIHRAGGAAVLAHPGQIAPHPSSMSLLIGQLAREGLDGIEAHYPGYGSNTIRELKKIAGRHKLVITGGSDYHGDHKPYSGMAGRKSRFCPPAVLLDPLVKKIDARRLADR
jgi:hypothetical protein